MPGRGVPAKHDSFVLIVVTGTVASDRVLCDPRDPVANLHHSKGDKLPGL